MLKNEVMDIEQFLRKVLDLLAGISRNLEAPFLLQNLDFWAVIIGAINVIVLALTLYFLIRYTRATEKTLENQLLPSVDVNMNYDKERLGTSFWFVNDSSVPASVSMTLAVNGDVFPIGPLRIHPFHSEIRHWKRTAPGSFGSFQKIFDNETPATLKVTVTPAIENTAAKYSFTKNYRFNSVNKEWDETTWSYPDPPFPVNI